MRRGTSDGSRARARARARAHTHTRTHTSSRHPIWVGKRHCGCARRTCSMRGIGALCLLLVCKVHLQHEWDRGLCLLQVHKAHLQHEWDRGPMFAAGARSTCSATQRTCGCWQATLPVRKIEHPHARAGDPALHPQNHVIMPKMVHVSPGLHSKLLNTLFLQALLSSIFSVMVNASVLWHPCAVKKKVGLTCRVKSGWGINFDAHCEVTVIVAEAGVLHIISQDFSAISFTSGILEDISGNLKLYYHQ